MHRYHAVAAIGALHRAALQQSQKTLSLSNDCFRRRTKLLQRYGEAAKLLQEQVTECAVAEEQPSEVAASPQEDQAAENGAATPEVFRSFSSAEKDSANTTHTSSTRT